MAHFGKEKAVNKLADCIRGHLFLKVQLIPKKYEPLRRAADGVLNFNKHGAGIIESA